jgi:hypothetical protein
MAVAYPDVARKQLPFAIERGCVGTMAKDYLQNFYGANPDSTNFEQELFRGDTAIGMRMAQLKALPSISGLRKV